MSALAESFATFAAGPHAERCPHGTPTNFPCWDVICTDCEAAAEAEAFHFEITEALDAGEPCPIELGPSTWLLSMFNPPPPADPANIPF